MVKSGGLFIVEGNFFFQFCTDQAARDATHNTAFTKDMLTREGAFAATNNQLTF